MGYLLTPALLLYGTGGLTYGDAYSQVSNLATYNASLPVDPTSYSRAYVGSSYQSQILTGWNAGGGFEWMLDKNWSIKAEGIYWNLGNINSQSTLYSSAPDPLQGCDHDSCSQRLIFGNTNINYQGVLARAGVNYHFDTGFFNNIR